MGWAGGSEMASNIWDLIKKHIPESKRQEVARAIIDIFEGEDCDTMYECDEIQEAAKCKK